LRKIQQKNEASQRRGVQKYCMPRSASSDSSPKSAPDLMKTVPLFSVREGDRL